MDKNQMDLLIEKYKMTPEDKHFDRKSAAKNVKDLARLVVAFANADGGTIVVGISDDGKVEGFKVPKAKNINDFIAMPKTMCQPMPKYNYQVLDVINCNGEADKILILDIEGETDRIIRTASGIVYIRIGDETRQLEGNDLRYFEYSKNERHYEDEIVPDATLNDLDNKLIQKFKLQIGAEDLSDEALLRARGFIRTVNNKDGLTNAAVLLFAKNILQFYQNCRVRFVRYDGDYMGVGEDYNVVKDINIDKPLLLLAEEVKNIIKQQLREFTHLDRKTGKFVTVPEYPEFAWTEGIINAIVHREYAFTGAHIRVGMYDDRLEIVSPGKLPGFVTVDNICENRFSRNQKICRVFYEMGWVRELNEGVKRIYKDMHSFFLEPPDYKETDTTVILSLKNNIVMRHIRRNSKLIQRVGIENWEELDDVYRNMLYFMTARTIVSKKDLVDLLKLSGATVVNRLNYLIETGLVKANGNKTSPSRTYEFIW